MTCDYQVIGPILQVNIPKLIHLCTSAFKVITFEDYISYSTSAFMLKTSGTLFFRVALGVSGMF